MAFLIVCLMGVVWLLPTAHAAELTNHTDATVVPIEIRQWSVSLRWENDAFGSTDRYYTDGGLISLTHSGPSWMDPVANWLPWGEGRRTVGYDVTQLMFTPADTSRRVPDPTDRPYAGVLTAGLALHVERSNSYNGLKLIAGVIGPWSLAETTQDEAHQIGGWGRPEGWDHQLKNEPVFDLAYEYRHKFRVAGQPDGWAVEALPSAGAMLGNLLTAGQVSGLLRFGYNIPNDFGLTLARGMGQLPPPQHGENAGSWSSWGFSIYGAGIANLVLRDITLDGNTFKDSPSVNKDPFVPAAAVGIAIGNRHFLGSFTYVFWGKEYENQQYYSRFGAVTLSYFF